MDKKYTHLHVHTQYSLLDGSIRIPELIKKTKDLGMDSIAITDHGSMFGIVDFYKEAKKEGIKPILGSEVYVAFDNHLDKDSKDKKNYHLVLLAENNIGYINLMKIVSEAYINGFYYRPRIDHNLLKRYKEGIIALSACLGGEVQNHILNNDLESARNVALTYREMLGKENFFLELQDHGIDEQKRVNSELIDMSRELDIPLIASNDVHYLNKEDAAFHDVLLCVQTGKTIDDEDRMRFETNEFYLKSPQEMYDLFHDNVEALENTYSISRRCNVELDFDTLHLPEYKVPQGYSNEEYLWELTEEGLKSKYGNISPEIKERFEFEHKTIVEMGYVDYFLIVWDFIRFAKDNEIMVGPGRGSAAGSIVSYGLGITDVDPLEHGLFFERFLNPERITMPDIDIDFCYERRDEVIDYVVDKYGTDRVAQISTFGTMAARGAIRDVGRALNMPYGEVDYIAKKIPNDLGITIHKALEVSKSLKDDYDSNMGTQRLLDVAMKVEGLPRHTSTHAAGVVIAKEPITNYAPLLKNKEAIATQFTMTELEELGLLKMDFLGLRTLTVIRDAVNLIRDNHNLDVGFSDITYDDKNVLDIFAKAETLGIFQFESPGMRAFLKELKADVFEDLIAANSLFRPGPMNQIPTFIAGKHDSSTIKYIHPKLEHILKDTYGCIVYQEQVMQIFREIGGYSMGRADIVRRAMGKKKMDIMMEERKNFIYGQEDEEGNIILEGAIRNGVDEKSAAQIYDLMIDFANYAFNKSHSVAYAIIAYRSAWLKYYYPVEFMAAQISSIMGNVTSTSLYIQECKRLNIEVLSPDINKSFGNFTVEENKIRFGLSAVKNVGHNLIEAAVKARENSEFKSFTDFVERVEATNSGVMNKRAVESLIKAGAFDSVGANRAQLLSIFDKTIDGIHSDKRRNIEGQFSLFDNNDSHSEDNLPNIKEFPQRTLLQMEKEMIGIYVSGHPLDSYKEQIEYVSSTSTAEILESVVDGIDQSIGFRDKQKVILAGIITEKKNMITKNNNMMAFVTLEDLYETIECIVFPNVFEKYNDYILEDKVVVVEGRLQLSEVEDPKIICESITPLKEREVNKIYIRLIKEDDTNIFKAITDILGKHPGKIPVYMYFQSNGKTAIAERKLWVNKEKDVVLELENLLGKENVKEIM